MKRKPQSLYVYIGIGVFHSLSTFYTIYMLKIKNIINKELSTGDNFCVEIINFFINFNLLLNNINYVFS